MESLNDGLISPALSGAQPLQLSRFAGCRSSSGGSTCPQPGPRALSGVGRGKAVGRRLLGISCIKGGLGRVADARSTYWCTSQDGAGGPDLHLLPTPLQPRPLAATLGGEGGALRAGLLAWRFVCIGPGGLKLQPPTSRAGGRSQQEQQQQQQPRPPRWKRRRQPCAHDGCFGEREDKPRGRKGNEGRGALGYKATQAKGGQPATGSSACVRRYGGSRNRNRAGSRRSMRNAACTCSVRAAASALSSFREAAQEIHFPGFQRAG